MSTLATPTPSAPPGSEVDPTGRLGAPRTPSAGSCADASLLASAPLVLLIVLVAARLMTLNAVHDQTLAGYQAGDKARTLTWGERQGWVNVVERFRAPFAIGDAHVLSGHFGLARPWFEEAFELVPKGGIEECKVRVNLGLTYEALGDEARARSARTSGVSSTRRDWRSLESARRSATRQRAARRANSSTRPSSGWRRRTSRSQVRMSSLLRRRASRPAADADPRSGERPQPGAAGSAAGAAATEHHRAQRAARHRRPR